MNRADGRTPDNVFRLFNFDARKFRGSRKKRVRRNRNAGRDNTAQIFAGGVYRVKSRRRAEIDDNTRRTVFFQRGNRIDNSVCADIAGASLAASRWAEGWGIRATPTGMLYNVSGSGAVEIRLRSGARFRLGSDEPDRLLSALQAAITAPPA